MDHGKNQLNHFVSFRAMIDLMSVGRTVSARGIVELLKIFVKSGLFPTRMRTGFPPAPGRHLRIGDEIKQ